MTACCSGVCVSRPGCLPHMFGKSGTHRANAAALCVYQSPKELPSDTAHLDARCRRLTGKGMGGQAKAEAYNTVARTCARGGMLDEGLALLEHMQKNNIEAGRATVSICPAVGHALPPMAGPREATNCCKA